MNPRHVNPQGERATAPYNFVPLPEKVLTVEGRPEWLCDGLPIWRCHDRFVPGARSGWVDLELTVRTPLFLGRSRDKQTAFAARDERGLPVVPGSSLRGLIRNMVEILSFSKLGNITGERPFFRSVGKDRIGCAYSGRMVSQGVPKVRAGYLRRNGRDYAIAEARGFRKVSHEVLRRFDRNFSDYVGERRQPNRPNISYKEDQAGRVTSVTSGGSAVLVVTGPIPNKKHEFIFDPPDGAMIPLAARVVERFLSEDQITKWQRGCFGSGLRDGEPIFFVSDDSGLFFGRAGMFRLPYERSPRELVPEAIRNAGVDIAEAMFGVVPVERGGRDTVIRGRLQFCDLRLKDACASEESGRVLLSSPKITAYPHYLTQNGPAGERELTSYLDGDDTTIRGTKLYWHGGGGVRPGPQGSGSQFTTMKGVVPPGAKFCGQIRFNNLNDIELGALWAALKLPEGCAHHLGMAKPYGYGAVSLSGALQLVDRDARYATWQAGGAREENPKQFVECFEGAVLQHAVATGETLFEGTSHTGLQKIARLDACYLLSKFPGPDFRSTGIMGFNGYKSKHVLPSPHGVVGKSEPNWPEHRPKAGRRDEPESGRSRRQEGSRGPQAGLRPGTGPGGGGSEPRGRSNALESPGRQAVPASQRGEHPVGSLVGCTVLEKRTKKGGPMFAIEGAPEEGVLHPQSKPLPDVSPGQKIGLVVRAPGRVYQLALPEPGGASGRRKGE